MARKRIFTDRRRSREAYLGGRKRSLTYTEPEQRPRPYEEPTPDERPARRPQRQSVGSEKSARAFDEPSIPEPPPDEPSRHERPARRPERRPAGGAEGAGGHDRRRPSTYTGRGRSGRSGRQRGGRRPGRGSPADRPAAARGRRPASRRKNVRLGLLLIAGILIALTLWFFIAVYPSPVGNLSPEPQSLVSAKEVKVAASLKKKVDREAFTLHVGGKDLTPKARLTDGGISCTVKLADGTHEATLTVDGGGLMGKRTSKWSFTVDNEPPELTLSSKKVTAIEGSRDVQVEFAGKVSKGAVLKAGDQEVRPDEKGAFKGSVRSSRAKSLEIAATDEAGNKAHTFIVTQKPTVAKGVHVSVYIASSDSDLNRMIELVERTELNALQIDLKDEAGQIAFELDYPLAKEAGANTNYVKLDSVVDKLRYRDIYTICRIVVMKDPRLTKARPDLTVQDSRGGAWSRGFWLDPYSQEVWDYNIAVAAAAARAGFQEIQFDYIRFPTEGDMSTCVFPSKDERTQREVINGFFEYAREKLAPYNVFISADLFGLTASKQGEMGIGQSVRDVAERVDYICPMVYPSHYNTGEYNIKVPEANPHDIVLASLKEFKKEMKGTQAKLRPWLQDFSLKITYTPDMVRRQIDACTEAGVKEWLLWDPDCTYSEAALEPAR